MHIEGNFQANPLASLEEQKLERQSLEPDAGIPQIPRAHEDGEHPPEPPRTYADYSLEQYLDNIARIPQAAMSINPLEIIAADPIPEAQNGARILDEEIPNWTADLDETTAYPGLPMLAEAPRLGM